MDQLYQDTVRAEDSRSRDEQSSEWLERIHFLEALAGETPQVLRTLYDEPYQACVSLRKRYLDQQTARIEVQKLIREFADDGFDPPESLTKLRDWPSWPPEVFADIQVWAGSLPAPKRINVTEVDAGAPNKRNFPRVPPTPEPYAPPRLTLSQLDYSSDPIEMNLLNSLRRWAASHNLRPDWIVETGLATIQMYIDHLGNTPPDPLEWWFPPIPVHLRVIVQTWKRGEEPRDLTVTPPPLPMLLSESLEDYMKRAEVAMEAWRRELGLWAKPAKTESALWHYRALALRVVERRRYTEMESKFNTKHGTIKYGATSAAKLVQIPEEDLELKKVRKNRSTA